MKGMIVVRVDRCLGCKSCELACAIEHSASKDLLAALSETPAPASRVKVGKCASFAVPLQCRQCEEAPCVDICPTQAARRADQHSPIVIDRELCIGCKCCIWACPFGVIRFDEKGRTLVKCDQCFEHLERGELPACVSACPTRALQFKTMDQILAEKRAGYLTHIEKSLAGTEK